MQSYEIASFLSDNPSRRKVFAEVAKSKSIRFRELVYRLSSMDEDEAKRHLEELQRAGLIDSKNASIDSLNTYYVTNDGLQAKRKVGI
jgi:DNA-binding transcriptional ArsR family regulator